MSLMVFSMVADTCPKTLLKTFNGAPTAPRGLQDYTKKKYNTLHSIGTQDKFMSTCHNLAK